ncbi:MAG: hypothetical protein ACKVW3_08615 [Phycisphaerales bacterium]
MALDVNALGTQMLGAMANELKAKWNAAKGFGESSAKSLATALVAIEAGRLNGSISEEQAKLLLDIHKNAARSVLLAAEGIALLAAEAAVNAAMKVVRDTVNTAVGFTLV